MSIKERVKAAIRDIPDFPKEGIIFKDITPILEDCVLVNDIVDYFVELYKDNKPDAIACIEARGFLFGTLIAHKLQIPFVPIRKQGKLPYETHSAEYTLEYGTAIMEMHKDAVKPGWNVLIHDDLLATGGTALAAAELIKIAGGTVAGFSFLVNLSFLKGSAKLSVVKDDVQSLISF